MRESTPVPVEYDTLKLNTTCYALGDFFGNPKEGLPVGRNKPNIEYNWKIKCTSLLY